MAARATARGINGRPVAISPRMYQQIDDHGGGVLSSIFCGSGDNAFLLCDGAPRSNEVDFDINPTGVYVAVHTKQWTLAGERLKYYPREASTWVVRYASPPGPDNATNAGSAAGGIASASSDRAENIAVASPRSGTPATLSPTHKPKVLKWRMLPIHAAVMFGAPVDLVKTLIKVYPAGLSAHDDQGMLPLHLAFRAGATEEMVLILVDAYPEAVERADFKGRLPSMLGPKTAMSYGDTIGEAFIKGPAYYYWASRVATADRVRVETAMMKTIKELEEKARVSNQEGKEMLDKTQKQLMEEIEALSVENVELKERLVWYETKYDGAEEKEKILVDHTNSLAERLRLTSLSEEHLATKLAKLEAKLESRETEMEQERATAKGEQKALQSRVEELEQALAKTEHKAESLTENLEKKVMESNEMKVRFEKERQLFEKQIDASKECLMELIASSKEDKRMFDADSKELRQQLQFLQEDVQKACWNEQRYKEDSQNLRHQLMVAQSDGKAGSGDSSARTMKHANADVQQRSAQHHSNNTMDPPVEEPRSLISKTDAVSAERSVYSTTKRKDIMAMDEEEEPFDTYVSTKSVTGRADQSRDDTECFSHQSDVGTALALGELTEDQRAALEQLDLGGSREEIAAKLSRVPGLTKNQVTLLVDVASSLV